ncbi:MAG: Nif3-like dinuclear metal center hexameric protein, partial [Bacteroidota bacterium]
MKIADIGNYLESLSPLSFQEDYDNCGFLTGNPDWEFQKALLCLDLTEEVMMEAVNSKCNLVVSHHPFIFKGIKKLVPGRPETTILTLAIRNNIAVYAIHTNLDNTLHGLNARVFSRLGISNYKILSPRTGSLSKLVTFCPPEYAEAVRNALFEAGAGTIGNYDKCSYNLEGEGTFRASGLANPFVGEINKLHVEKELRIEMIMPEYLESRVVKALLAAHPYEEVAYDIYQLRNAGSNSGAGLIGELANPMGQSQFLAHLKKCLEIPVIRHSELLSSEIKSIALCTGSGSFLLSEALNSGADAFLTADLKYHDFFDAGKRMLLADIGHYESEQWVKEWLYDALIEKFPTFAFLISEVNTNPVHYF